MRSRTTQRTMYSNEQRILLGLGAAIVLISALYVYFISVSIMNVVLREEMQVAIAQANTRIGDLESEYLAGKNTLNESFVTEHGYTPVISKSFIESDRNLTLNN